MESSLFPDWKAVELDLDPDRPVRIVLPEKLKFEYFRIHLRVQILLCSLTVHVQHSLIKAMISLIQVPLLLGLVEPQQLALPLCIFFSKYRIDIVAHADGLRIFV